MEGNRRSHVSARASALLERACVCILAPLFWWMLRQNSFVLAFSRRVATVDGAMARPIRAQNLKRTRAQ